MSEQTKPKYGVIVQATALIVALLMYTTSMTTPALSAIQEAFPDASAETVKLISSSGASSRYVNPRSALSS